MRLRLLLLAFAVLFVVTESSGRVIQSRQYPTFTPGSPLALAKAELDSAIQAENALAANSQTSHTSNDPWVQQLAQATARHATAQAAFDDAVAKYATPQQKLLILQQQQRDAQGNLAGASSAKQAYANTLPVLTSSTPPDQLPAVLDTYNSNLASYQAQVDLFNAQLVDLAKRIEGLKQANPSLA